MKMNKKFFLLSHLIYFGVSLLCAIVFAPLALETYFFANLFATIFSIDMLFSLTTLFISFLAYRTKDEAWRVRLHSVALVLLAVEVIPAFGTAMAVVCVPYFYVWTFLIALFISLATAQLIVFFVLTKSWEDFLLGFKGMAEIRETLAARPQEEPKAAEVVVETPVEEETVEETVAETVSETPTETNEKENQEPTAVGE